MKKAIANTIVLFSGLLFFFFNKEHSTIVG